MTPKLLIIPDPHAHPEYDNDRFAALGEFVVREKPDVIVCLGDWGDMPSLSSYDKGKRSFEGRRYHRDIEAVHDSLKKFHNPINRYNKKRKQGKANKYSPELYLCLGNHENRIEVATNNQPELHGIISFDDLGYQDYGWNVIPYQKPLLIDGVSFCHHFASGIAGRPISGEHIAASLCNKLHCSAVVGHSHVFNHAERTRPDGVKIFGLSAGCYSHPDQVEGWNYATHHLWWRGVLILEDVQEGYYNVLRSITMRKVCE